MISDDETAQLADRMVSLLRRTWGIDRPIAWLRVVIRLLAEGAPVPITRIADEIGVAEKCVRRVLRRVPESRWTTDGQLSDLVVVSVPTPYRLSTPTGVLHVASGVDALLVPVLLGWPATLTTTCQVTGTAILLEMWANEIVEVEPDHAVASVFAHPELVTTRYRQVGSGQTFFRSDAAASRWLASHPDYITMPVRTAGRYVNRLAGND